MRIATAFSRPFASIVPDLLQDFDDNRSQVSGHRIISFFRYFLELIAIKNCINDTILKVSAASVFPGKDETTKSAFHRTPESQPHEASKALSKILVCHYNYKSNIFLDLPNTAPRSSNSNLRFLKNCRFELECFLLSVFSHFLQISIFPVFYSNYLSKNATEIVCL